MLLYQRGPCAHEDRVLYAVPDSTPNPGGNHLLCLDKVRPSCPGFVQAGALWAPELVQILVLQPGRVVPIVEAVLVPTKEGERGAMREPRQVLELTRQQPTAPNTIQPTPVGGVLRGLIQVFKVDVGCHENSLVAHWQQYNGVWVEGWGVGVRHSWGSDQQTCCGKCYLVDGNIGMGSRLLRVLVLVRQKAAPTE